ncbi:MAG: glycosyltransferase [Patescibacteria group bacterium]
MALQKKSKKIVFISGTFPPTICGVGMYSYRLLQELSKYKGAEIHLITSNIDNLKSINNIEIHKVNRKWDIKTFNQVIDIIRKVDPDIIHLQHPTLAYQFRFDTFILGMKLKKNFPKIPKIITEHELSQAHPIAKIRNLTLLPFFDHIIVTNINDFKYLKKFKVFNKKVYIINIFPSNYYDIPTKKGSNFCYIGTIDSKKGLEYLIDTIKILKDKNIDINLDILTNLYPETNHSHKKIIEKIKNLDLQDNIILNKPKDGMEIAKKISQSFAVILPFNLGVSERNGTFLEAISYGKPVITTKGKNTPTSIFINNKNCILIEPKNVEQIVQNIIKLTSNKTLYNQISKGALSLSRKYNLISVKEKYLKFYQQL